MPETTKTSIPEGVSPAEAENLVPEDDESEGFTEILRHTPIIEIIESKNEHPVGLDADIAISVRCPEGCDLSGGTLNIVDENGQVIAEQTLAVFDEIDGLNTTGSFSVPIPKEPGDYTWTVTFYPLEGDAEKIDSKSAGTHDPGRSALEETQTGTEEGPVILHASAKLDYCFKAVGHLTGITVWRNNREPVTVGSEYLLYVGVGCVHGCSLLGQTVKVYQKDVLLGSMVMGEPEPPLASLYQNKIALTAPDEVGAYTLECQLELEGLDLSHNVNTAKYTLTTNMPAQCRLEIMAISEKDDTLIKKTFVVVRPKGGYPAYIQSGEDGKASIGVPWGDVHIEASPNEHDGVKADITIPEGQEVFELTLTAPELPISLY